ncbi:MAG TPA: phospholipase D family protein [Tepidisphaeraceae bacterium]
MIRIIPGGPVAMNLKYRQPRGGGVAAPAIVWLALVLGGCTVLPATPSGAPSHALADTSGTTLGQFAACACGGEGAESNVSAVCILDRGKEAFVSRIALIDLAERSVDVQTYSWSADRTGRLLAAHLLRAADRGVRVRVLVDDIDTGGRDFNIAMFDASPNIEVRLYNPFRMRFGWRVLRPIEMLFNMDRLDHRMHNKTFVVDNQAAVIGGRNIADEYFGVNPDFDYRDFDLLALGGAAAQVSACFDAYWADPRSYPIHDVSPHAFEPADVRAARDRLYAFAAAQRATFPYRLPESRDQDEGEVVQVMASAVTATTEVLFDDPSKGEEDVDASQPSHVRAVLARSPPRHELLVVNPYFIPQDHLVAALESARKRGIAVRVLTNSMASTDVVAVHAAYAKRREGLLAAGVALSELRPDAEARADLIAADCPRATLALHAKAMVLDRDRVFVGSLNLDPRSHRLNTEAGILAHSPELAAQVARALGVEFEPANAWRLSLDQGHVVWSTSRGGATVTDRDDPDASFWRRIKCGVAQLLPIENEL